MVGISKTGVPGAGVFVSPLLAKLFGGFQSIGVMLPMLIVGDVFAVLWYRRHAQWNRIIGLIPWVLAGMAIGAVSLWALGESQAKKDVLGPIIGVLTLGMLAVTLLQDRLDQRFTPTSKIGVIGTGLAAGFTTMVSNAAGPIMTIYMAANRVTKKEFIGTLAWYFFTLNLAKVPVYGYLTAAHPDKAIFTETSLLFNLAMCPAIIVGVFFGKWLLPRVSQQAFDRIVLTLAAVSAVWLITR